jgi:hypothetical protein
MASVDLRFGELGQLGGSGFALTCSCGRGDDRLLAAASDSALNCFRISSLVFDFGELAGDFFAEGDDFA